MNGRSEYRSKNRLSRLHETIGLVEMGRGEGSHGEVSSAQHTPPVGFLVV